MNAEKTVMKCLNNLLFTLAEIVYSKADDTVMSFVIEDTASKIYLTSKINLCEHHPFKRRHVKSFRS